MRHSMARAAVAIGMLVGILSADGQELHKLALVPQPQRIQQSPGEFVLNKDTRILVESDSADAGNVGDQLAERLNRSTGFKFQALPSETARPENNCILLSTKNANTTLGTEGYTLHVTPAGAVISATAGPGLFYGMQTLLQLLPPQIFRMAKAEQPTAWTIPGVRVEDRPRFRWRGLMLDVSRHFFSKSEVENFIDLMAQHKMNTFHWHLVDGVGWRIEIQRFPKLTQIGTWRKDILFGLNPKDGTAWGPDGQYGGYYSHDDIREIVAYAAKRYVTIVPELEMPGHSAAALKAYPEYSCTGEANDFEGTKGAVDEYCAGNDGTFDFLEGILTEVIELFPGKYIHVGGDEVKKEHWKKCPKCQARMQREGLKNENELQGYFVRRIARFVNSQHRAIIGWDEILEGGGLPLDATVMSWRGIEGGIAASKAGHDAVMAPVTHCYFDYYQAKSGEPVAIGGFLPLQTVYSFEPVPAGLAPDKTKYILGADANLWTEFVPNYAHVQYMTYPRACAMSEVTWSDPKRKDWSDFCSRLDTHLELLQAEGVNYRRPKISDESSKAQ